MKLKIFVFLFLIFFLSSPFWSGGVISPFEYSSEQLLILGELRIPRILTAFFSGGVLALSGLIFQNLFQNHLATPYTLGISSGASLFVGLSIFMNISGVSISIFALVGSLFVTGLIFFTTKLMNRFNVNYLLLVGVAIGLFNSSFLFMLHILGDSFGLASLFNWTLGNTDVIGYLPVGVSFFSALGLLYFSFVRQSEITIMNVSEMFAQSKGVDVVRVQKEIFIVVSFCVGLIISQVGPIGFIGLIIPNLLRSMNDFVFRNSFLLCFVIGGSFLSIVDSLSRTFIEITLPIGAVTTIIGAPYFIYILLKKFSKA